MSDDRQIRAQALYAARQAALAPRATVSTAARSDAAISLPAWGDLDETTQDSFLAQADRIPDA